MKILSSILLISFQSTEHTDPDWNHSSGVRGAMHIFLPKIVLFYKRFYLINCYWGQRKITALFHSSVLVKELGIKPDFQVGLSSKPHLLAVTVYFCTF